MTHRIRCITWILPMCNLPAATMYDTNTSTINRIMSGFFSFYNL